MGKSIAQLRKEHPGKYVFSFTFAAPFSDLTEFGDNYCGILPVETDEELAALVRKFRRLLLDHDKTLPQRKAPKGMVRITKKAVKSSEESE